VRRGYSILQPIADAYLVKDVEHFAYQVNDAVTYPKLTQGMFDALVSFTYNLGVGNLRKSTLLRKLNEGDIRGAAAQFMSWTHAAGKQMPGLVRRRAAEESLFLS
jgi:lysozyme